MRGTIIGTLWVLGGGLVGMVLGGMITTEPIIGEEGLADGFNALAIGLLAGMIAGGMVVFVRWLRAPE